MPVSEISADGKGAQPCKPLPPDDLEHVLRHTRELWSEAKGASFFITGGTGFFGMWLLESFAHINDALGLNMQAMVLTRDSAAFAHKAPHMVGRGDISFCQGDLRTFVFPEGPFTHLIHAAADTDVWTKSEPTTGLIERVVVGIEHLLDFAAVAGVKHCLHVSSGAVYGPQSAELTHMPEDYPGMAEVLPAGAVWAEGKRVGEQLFLAYAAKYGLSVKIARGFAFVGPHLDKNYAIGNFICDALHGRSIQVKGDGTPLRSYLYAADLAIWLWTLLLAGASGRAYNVGSPVSRSIREVAEAVAAASGEALQVEISETPASAFPLASYVPAVKRAEVELGLRVWIPLDEAIRKTLAWHRSGRDVFSPCVQKN